MADLRKPEISAEEALKRLARLGLEGIEHIFDRPEDRDIAIASLTNCVEILGKAAGIDLSEF